MGSSRSKSHLPSYPWPEETGQVRLTFWAIVGVRNEYPGKTWKEVAEWNFHYCQTGLNYWSNAALERLSLSVFGNCSWPMGHFIEHAPGGFATMARRLPLRKLWSYVGRQTRMAVLLTRKTQ